MASKLSEKDKDVVFLYSELLHDKKKRESSIEQFLKELADNERMSCDVLIATKCLDVGVTIKDKNVNIVSFLHDRVDFLQSIGRKRVKAGETVNLLIPEYTKRQVEQWLNNTKQCLEEYKQNCKLYPENRVANGFFFESPIYVDNGVYKHNSLIYYKLYNTRRMLQGILEKLEISEKADHEVIAECFSEWMPCCKYLSGGQSDETMKEILTVIEPYRVAVMDGETFNDLKEKLSIFDPRTDQRESRKGLSTRTVNSIIEPLELMISHNKNSGKDVYKIVPRKKTEEE